MAEPRLKKDEMSVSDLSILAVLDAVGIPPSRYEFSGTRLIGVFDRDRAWPSYERYQRGTLQVGARDLTDSIRRIKDMIYEHERDEKRRNQK